MFVCVFLIEAKKIELECEAVLHPVSPKQPSLPDSRPLTEVEEGSAGGSVTVDAQAVPLVR